MENILNGLECCEHMSGDYCQKCSYLDEYESDIPPTCTARLAHDALVLIKELQKRVERLEIEVHEAEKKNRWLRY